MDQKKKEVLFSILNGKLKVEESLKESERLERELKGKFDLDKQNKFNKAYDQFKINLCNFYRAIRDKKEYFEDYDKIEEIVNKPVKLRTWKEEETLYTLDNLLGVFRNRNEHYDKIDQESQYILFKTSVTKEQLMELYSCCNEVLNKEINKLNEEDIPKYIFSNPELKSAFNNAIMNVIESNDKAKEQMPELYEFNFDIIEFFKNINFDTMTAEEFENVYNKIKEYLHDEKYKKIFIDRYGIKLYNHLIDMYESEDSSDEEDKKKVNYFFNEILKI